MKPTDPQFKLRLPLTLKTQLEAAAAAEGRTLTAEIVQRLEEVEALRHEVARLSRHMDEYERESVMLDATLKMLAGFFVEVYRSLPEAAQRDRNFVPAMEFAMWLAEGSPSTHRNPFGKLLAARAPGLRPHIRQFRRAWEATPKGERDEEIEELPDEPDSLGEEQQVVRVPFRTSNMSGYVEVPVHDLRPEFNKKDFEIGPGGTVMPLRVRAQKDGALSVSGSAEGITDLLRANGIWQVAPDDGGVVVLKSQAEAARELLAQLWQAESDEPSGSPRKPRSAGAVVTNGVQASGFHPPGSEPATSMGQSKVAVAQATRRAARQLPSEFSLPSFRSPRHGVVPEMTVARERYIEGMDIWRYVIRGDDPHRIEEFLSAHGITEVGTADGHVFVGSSGHDTLRELFSELLRSAPKKKGGR